MPQPFWRATAEAVVASVDAVYVYGKPADPDYVADFAQLTRANAEAALGLAVSLGLLKTTMAKYVSSSPLCRALSTANQQRKATALRVALEDYEPFVTFRARLLATGDATTAARQVKQLLQLDSHHEEIKETLLSLGQYSQALIAEGGGAYRPQGDASDYDLKALADGCASDAAAEQLIRQRLGARAVDKISRDDVIVPLANALQRAKATDARGAVVSAGNAIESYLTGLGTRLTVNLAGKPGINAKAEELGKQCAVLPTKLVQVSKYLGHVRNAADHGIDSDINAPWEIREATGLEYVFVACSFIAAVTEREVEGATEI